jgi:hypothetical protein
MRAGEGVFRKPIPNPDKPEFEKCKVKIAKCKFMENGLSKIFN